MRSRSWIACSVLAAIAYLAIALWNFRAVLPEPATRLPENPHLSDAYTRLGRLDLTMVLWMVTGNAERLLSRPWALRAEGQCHPLPRAYTLGEHMLGESVLAAVPLLLSDDPIVSYNVLLVLTLWIPALAMYALALHFTRSPAAAFVAGLLFCLEPERIRDSGHPFVHGDLWGPLVLLFLHRTLARGGFGNALACALFLGLTLLESIYALLGVLTVATAYGAWSAFRHRQTVRRWLVPMLVAAVLVAGFAVVVLRPYLLTRATWDVLVRSGTMFMPLLSYAPGHAAFPGWALLGLVALGLADRVRRQRLEEGEDPRLALACAALLVIWCSVRTVPIAGFEVPSPFLLLKQIVPGLDAVRALATVGRCAALAAAVIAAYGVLALVERTGARRAALIAGVVGAIVLAERFVPALSTASFGSPLDLAAYPARPPEDDIALLREHGRGALLHLPFAAGPARQLTSGGFLMLASFRPGPTAACYNSYPSPLHDQVAELAGALPHPEAIEALVALGFETLLVHTDRMRPERVAAFTARAADPRHGERMELRGRTPRLMVWRLRGLAPVGSDLAQLAAVAPAGAADVAGGAPELRLAFRNASERTWRHPEPIAPTPVEARWVDAAGRVAHAERTRMVLPLAIASGAAAHAPLRLTAAPPAGTYDLTIHPVTAPDVAIAWTRVRVAAPAS